MYLGQEYQVFDWFYIHFTENNGMAFGMEFGGDWEAWLSLFSIVFVVFMAFFLLKLIRKRRQGSYCILIIGPCWCRWEYYYWTFRSFCFLKVTESSLLFYLKLGLCATVFGKVVDMFYFPIFKGYLPEWIPFGVAIILCF